MQLVVDENITLVDELLAPFGGDVIKKQGRSLTNADLQNANALFVRSVTPVDKTLLHDTPVSFVGSATIGTDHIDLDYLAERNIAVSAAPGCNADAVVQYVVAALLELEARGEAVLGDAVIGIVGMGNVGGRVCQLLRQWGHQVLVCDPPLAQSGTSDEAFVSLEDVLKADIISLHAPLVEKGEYPTRHLLGKPELESLKPHAVLINSARGALIDNQALNQVLQDRGDLSIVLDVWEGEPALNVELANRVDIATPHIAGYSYDGKVKGTLMVAEAFARHLQRQDALLSAASIAALMPDALNLSVGEHSSAPSPLDCKGLIEKVYRIMDDDVKLRAGLTRPIGERIAAFDQQRKHYGLRREFGFSILRGGQAWLASLPQAQRERVLSLGFQFA